MWETLLLFALCAALLCAATQTTGTLTNEDRTFYDRVLLEAARPTLIHDRWGQKRPLSRRTGRTINFRRFELLATATTALVEGVTPAGNDLTINKVEATIAQYGAYVTISDVLDWTGIDPVLTETTEIQGVQAGETLDELIRDVIIAGSTVRYAGGQTARANLVAADKINGSELRKLRRTMRKNKAKPAAESYFPLIVSPDTHYDLQGMSEWVGLAQESRPEALESGMVGRIWGFKVFETDKAKIFTGAGSGGIDVHGSLGVGKNYYGLTAIEGHAMETIRKPIGSGGTEDPLNQRGSVGWKASHVSMRLNENFAARLEHAVTG